MIEIFKRLLGIKTDPTVGWPTLPPSTPALDLRTVQIGPLSFWDPIDKARELGRPDACQRVVGKVDELLFARAGYLLEFYRKRFSYAAYFIAADGGEDSGQAHEALTYARPRVIWPNGTAGELSADLDLDALEEALGKPESADVDEEESVIVWKQFGVTIEAELNAHGRLKRFNLYPAAK